MVRAETKQGRPDTTEGESEGERGTVSGDTSECHGEVRNYAAWDDADKMRLGNAKSSTEG